MKTRIPPLIFGAAILATTALWNTDATAQSDSPAARVGLKPPLNRNCIVTLDAQSDSRASMTTEMQRISGFVRHNTVQGTLIHVDAAWLVLKDGEAENWVPRDKVLMLHANR